LLEGVSYSQKDCLEIIEQLGVLVKSVRISGGGGQSAFWRQLLADILQKPIVTLETQEGSAYGAALLALAGTTGSSVPDVCRAAIREIASVLPHPEEAGYYDNAHAVYRALYPALKPVYRMISNL
jgi:xylulokinase